MATAKSMTEIYDANFEEVKKYVHATSRGSWSNPDCGGHAAQSTGFCRSLLSWWGNVIVHRADTLMNSCCNCWQRRMIHFLLEESTTDILAWRDDDKPKIPTQTSATGMQAIPTTGVAMGMQYKEARDIDQKPERGEACGRLLFWGCLDHRGAKCRKHFKWRRLNNCLSFTSWKIMAGIFQRVLKNFAPMMHPNISRDFMASSRSKVNGSDFIECYEGYWLCL